MPKRCQQSFHPLTKATSIACGPKPIQLQERLRRLWSRRVTKAMPRVLLTEPGRSEQIKPNSAHSLERNLNHSTNPSTVGFICRDFAFVMESDSNRSTTSVIWSV